MLEIISITPIDKSIAISVNSTIEVAFNSFIQNIDESSFFLTRKNSNKIIPSSLIKVADDVWKLIPENLLKENTNYSIHLTEDITNIDNESLDPITFSFKTIQNTLNPFIVDTYPGNNQQSVKTSTCIEIIFSEEMHNISSETVFLRKIIDNEELPFNIDLTIQKFSPTSWKIFPNVNLEPQTEYICKIVNAEDDQGNLIADYSFTFFTEYNISAPEIIARDPSPGDTGVLINETIYIQFSEPVYNVNSQTVKLFKIGSDIAINVLNPDPNAIQIVPNSNLDYDSEYTIIIDGVTDDSGNLVVVPEYSFKTQFSNELPLVEETIPLDNQSSVPVQSSVIITFTKPVFNVSTSSLFLTSSNNEAVIANLIKRNDFQYEIKPLTPLAPNTLYELNILNDIIDDEGNSVSYANNISFTTEFSLDKPGVLSVQPIPGETNTPLNSAITVVFNKPVFNVGINSFILESAEEGKILGNYSSSGNSWVFTPGSPLKKDTIYKVILKNTITDDIGRKINSFVYTFKTENFQEIAIKSISYYTNDINTKVTIGSKQTNIPEDAKILVEFNKEPLNTTGNIELNPGNYIINTVNTNVIEIVPDPILQNNTDYTLTLDKSITDDRGFNLIQDKVFYFTTKIIPSVNSNNSLSLVNNTPYLIGGVDKNQVSNENILQFNNGNWENTIIGNDLGNSQNPFSIYSISENKIYFIGGLSLTSTRVKNYYLDLTNNEFNEIPDTTETPLVIDWAGLIKVWNSNTSQLEEFIVALSFYSDGTQIHKLNTTTLNWEILENDGSEEIKQAIGSFVWVNQGSDTNNCSLFIMGGMRHTNNNLPLKEIQKANFYIASGGDLKYDSSTEVNENNLLFKSPLAFNNGLRTNRKGNNPYNRGKFNNLGISSLQCEETYNLSCGVFEKGTQNFIPGSNLLSNILLVFFVNPPDGVIKPFIQIYQTENNSWRFNLPNIDQDYPFTNRTNFSLSPTSFTEDKANELLLHGGRSQFNEELNSTWLITPSNNTNNNFHFFFKKNSPFFTK